VGDVAVATPAAEALADDPVPIAAEAHRSMATKIRRSESCASSTAE
jgi:hypothetical protein